MVNDADKIVSIMKEFRDYGFIVEMDDFGSGYSSLNLLKDINLDLIKIDMQFLKDSERNIKASLIIKNIINMSEDLGIDTLTEGVETAKQFEKLYDMGCKLYQGYYFSKPVPVEDFEKQWFERSISVPFEDTTIFVPNGYHECLTKLFGDYMQLPPKEKRTSHHKMFYVDLENTKTIDDILKENKDLFSLERPLSLKIIWYEIKHRKKGYLRNIKNNKKTTQHRYDTRRKDNHRRAHR